MEINQIRYVLRVAECKSFSRAAEKLSVTQPTLTQQISKLENELGVALFHRTTRTVALTDAGVDFVTYASRITESLDDLVDIMKMYKASSNGILHIGILPHVTLFGLPKRISVFAFHNDALTLDINQASSRELALELLDRKTDVAFINARNLDDRMRASLDLYPLCREPIGILLSKKHPLSNSKVVDIGDLKDLLFLHYESYESLDDLLRHWFAAHDMEYRVSEKHYSPEELVYALQQGDCASLMPLTAIDKLDYTSVTCIPVSPEIACELTMATLKGRNFSSPLKQFTGKMIESYKKTASGEED